MLHSASAYWPDFARQYQRLCPVSREPASTTNLLPLLVFDCLTLSWCALQALEYARRSLGFAPEHTVACGDSGNDVDMLEGDHLSIVVGNAQPDLRAWAEARLRRLGAEQAHGTPPNLIIAHASRAWGILEGLERFGFK
jgi:hypothetical protein